MHWADSARTWPWLLAAVCAAQTHRHLPSRESRPQYQQAEESEGATAITDVLIAPPVLTQKRMLSEPLPLTVPCGQLGLAVLLDALLANTAAEEEIRMAVFQMVAIQGIGLR